MAAGLPSIPLSLRPSRMMVRVPKDADYGGAYEDEQVIEQVRFVKKGALGKNDYRLIDGAVGLVFVDATSRGAFAVPVGSLITIDGGETLEVKVCRQDETWAGAVHHWELEVG